MLHVLLAAAVTDLMAQRHLDPALGPTNHRWKISPSGLYFIIEGEVSPSLQIDGVTDVMWGEIFPLTGIRFSLLPFRDGTNRGQIKYNIRIESPALGISEWSTIVPNLAALYLYADAADLNAVACAGYTFACNDLRLVYGGVTLWESTGAHLHSGDIYYPNFNKPESIWATDRSRTVGGAVLEKCPPAGAVDVYYHWLWGGNCEVGWEWDNAGVWTAETCVFDTGMSVAPGIPPPWCDVPPSCSHPIPSYSYVDCSNIDLNTMSEVTVRTRHEAGNVAISDYEESGEYAVVAPFWDGAGDLLDVRRQRITGLACSIHPPIFNYNTITVDSVTASTYSEHMQVAKRIEGHQTCIPCIRETPPGDGGPGPLDFDDVYGGCDQPAPILCEYGAIVSLRHPYPCFTGVNHVDIDWDRKVRRSAIVEVGGNPTVLGYSEFRPPTFTANSKVTINHVSGAPLRIKYDQRNSKCWMGILYLETGTNYLRLATSRTNGASFEQDVEISKVGPFEDYDFEITNAGYYYTLYTITGSPSLHVVGQGFNGSGWIADSVLASPTIDADTRICVREAPQVGMQTGFVLAYINGGQLKCRDSVNGIDYDVATQVTLGTAVYGVVEVWGTHLWRAFVWKEAAGDTTLKCSVLDSTRQVIISTFTIPGLTIDVGTEFAICEGRAQKAATPLLEIAYFLNGELKVATTENFTDWTIW